MEKKRSVGVTVFGLFAIIVAFLFLGICIPSIRPNSPDRNMWMIIVVVIAVTISLSAIGVLMKKNWGRKWAMISSLLVMLQPLFIFYPIITFIYLTRPKVKEQFK